MVTPLSGVCQFTVPSHCDFLELLHLRPWLERLVSETTCYVSSGTLNSTNSTQLI